MDDSNLLILLNIANLATLVIGLLVVCLALFVIYREFKVSHVANVYVINLLISDLIQFLGRSLIYLIYAASLITLPGMVSSIGFMVCIAMERYLLIAHPHWYRTHFTFKLTVVTSGVVWLISLAEALSLVTLPGRDYFLFSIVFILMMLIPFPLLLFFFVGTWRGLSKATTLSSREKKRILATLLVVIANYSFLFLPLIVSFSTNNISLMHKWVPLLIFLSPLLDPLLYIFIRKDTKHIMEEFPCCHRSSRNEEQTISSIVVSETIRSG